MISVWPFDEAPTEYQKLSPHGGDEDWVIYDEDVDGWGQAIADRLMVCDYSTHEMTRAQGGGTVWITCHA